VFAGWLTSASTPRWDAAILYLLVKEGEWGYSMEAIRDCLDVVADGTDFVRNAQPHVTSGPGEMKPVNRWQVSASVRLS
jgi:hypothetical protein